MCGMSGNRILMHGGVDFSGNALSDSWMFDAESQSWQQLGYKHSGSFDVMKSSVCGSIRNSSVVFGTESQSGTPTAWMMQHDFGVLGKLLMSNQVDGSRGLEFQSGLVVSGISVSFGGRNGYSMSNRVVVYRPGFCVSGSGVSVSSGFQSAQFDDGSGDAMYLKNTNCLWRLENATNIVVEKRMRPVDSLRIMNLDGQTELTAIEKTQMQDGSERLVYSGSGFVVTMEASESKKETGQPCEGCFGFKIIHAACDINSVFDSLQSQCKCKDGFKFLQDGCVEAISQEAGSESVVGLATGLSVSGFVVAVALVGVFAYRRKVRRDFERMNKKLFAVIPSQELEILELIGTGSFGNVYKALWRGTEVAVKKLIHEDLSEKAIEDFKAEISIMVELRHPNIVLYMGACLEPKNLCIVSELMQGGTLYAVLHSPRAINFQLRIQFIHDIAKGMQYLHSSNPPIIHRDLKSVNILVDDRNRLKISDFGLTTIQEAQTEGELVGSMLWMAPEVLRDKKSSAAADVYSFSIIAWEILTRLDPYHDIENMFCVLDRVMHHGARPVIPADCPGEIREVLQESWCEDAAKRLDFHEICKRLSKLILQQSQGSSTDFVRLMDFGEIPPDGYVGVVCVRIEGADSLWEDIPEVMCESLMAHNSLIRKMSAKHHGFVGTLNSDGGVIVFTSIEKALRFCVEAQEALYEHNWPESLLEHPKGKEDKKSQIKGLRVAMGISFGEVTWKRDEHTEDVHFKGNVVLEAMRVCRGCAGGHIIATEKLHQMLVESGDESLEPICEISECIEFASSSGTSGNMLKLHEVLSKKLPKRSSNYRAQESNSQSSLSTTTPNADGTIGAETNKAVRLFESVDGAQKSEQRVKKAWEIDIEDLIVRKTLLGAGSYGSVYKGFYKKRLVAVKKINKSNYIQEFVIGFIAEVSILRRVQHENVVQFIGAYAEIPNVFIVTEIVEPGSLRDVLRNKRMKLDRSAKNRILEGIVKGMAHLHSYRPTILHRDLKPANILVNHEFHARICDFGFARLRTRNRTMTKCGTCAYQAPEIMKGEKYTEKVDVYSFGIVLWEIETRSPPYGNMEVLDIQAQVMKGLRPDIREGMHPLLVKLMKRCWDDDANMRPDFETIVIPQIEEIEEMEGLKIENIRMSD